MVNQQFAAQLPINALNGKVGTGTKMSGYPTYQELGLYARTLGAEDNFQMADNSEVMARWFESKCRMRLSRRPELPAHQT